jgi:hypothetical protein
MDACWLPLLSFSKPNHFKRVTKLVLAVLQLFITGRIADHQVAQRYIVLDAVLFDQITGTIGDFQPVEGHVIGLDQDHIDEIRRRSAAYQGHITSCGKEGDMVCGDHQRLVENKRIVHRQLKDRASARVVNKVLQICSGQSIEIDCFFIDIPVGILIQAILRRKSPSTTERY